MIRDKCLLDLPVRLYDRDMAGGENILMNIQQLEKDFHDAYMALPEPYKCDSCLEFFKIGEEDQDDDILWARPVKGQEAAIGDGPWVFEGGNWKPW
jgi:hypothetical protein